jgi:hypothetical protein
MNATAKQPAVTHKAAGLVSVDESYTSHDRQLKHTCTTRVCTAQDHTHPHALDPPSLVVGREAPCAPCVHLSAAPPSVAGDPRATPPLQATSAAAMGSSRTNPSQYALPGSAAAAAAHTTDPLGLHAPLPQHHLGSATHSLAHLRSRTHTP